MINHIVIKAIVVNICWILESSSMEIGQKFYSMDSGDLAHRVLACRADEDWHSSFGLVLNGHTWAVHGSWKGKNTSLKVRQSRSKASFIIIKTHLPLALMYEKFINRKRLGKKLIAITPFMWTTWLFQDVKHINRLGEYII